jgi:pimeloyl-ACP methyl ester carboxylesterase
MSLAHEVTGTGPPVLLLHALVGDRRMWDPQVPVLVAAGFQVIRCDIAGFGESPMPAGPYNDADDVLELLGPAPAAIVAASGSGNVALELAARWPSRVSALALICSALSGWPASPARQAFAEQEDALLAAGDIDAATELNFKTFVGPAADDAARDAVRRQQRRIFEIQLALTEEPPPIEVPWEFGFDGPALIVSGDHDLPDFTAIAASLADRLPASRWVRLDWAGHLPSLEDPGRFNPLLLDFLTGVRPAG